MTARFYLVLHGSTTRVINNSFATPKCCLLIRHIKPTMKQGHYCLSVVETKMAKLLLWLGSSCNLFDSPVKKLYLKKVKRRVYSWANGTSCSRESQYLFSKSLLLHELQVNQQVRSALGSSAIAFILTWLNSKLFPHENTYVFWKKTYIRCLDEYMNNSAEAMNKSCKKSDISAKPNMSMDKAANAMLTYTQLQTRVRRSREDKNLLSTPLFVDPTVHNIHVLEKLSQNGQHLVLNQFVERNNYTVMCTSQNTWRVFRDNIDLSPHSVLDIPRFRNVWKVQKDSNGVFVCQCGFKHRYGFPCRHLFSIEPCYDLDDIDVRWHNDFGYFAYHPQAGLGNSLLLLQVRRRKTLVSGAKNQMSPPQDNSLM